MIIPGVNADTCHHHDADELEQAAPNQPFAHCPKPQISEVTKAVAPNPSSPVRIASSPLTAATGGLSDWLMTRDPHWSMIGLGVAGSGFSARLSRGIVRPRCFASLMITVNRT